MSKYTEILRLEFMLKDANIEHEFSAKLNGFRIYIPKLNVVIAEHAGSYGNESNKLELWEVNTDEISGWMAADDVYREICDRLQEAV